MLDIEIKGTGNLHQYEELVKIFLQPSQYRVHDGSEGHTGSDKNDTLYLKYDASEDEKKTKYEDRYETARKMYEDLASYTGKRPKWGVLTGIRPVKLAGELDCASPGSAERILRERYLAHPDKAGLVTGILDYQRALAGEPEDDSFSLYVGIPFCPTRCLYCSFTSNQVDVKEMYPYVEALSREIAYASAMTEKSGLKAESIYIGGGTPTALPADLLDRMLGEVIAGFAHDGLREFTVEAGRPDTIDEEKLDVLRRHGINKISINPQSMKQHTLDLIGRQHTVEDTVKAFGLARKAGISSINMDVIAGLPGETVNDFMDTLDEITDLGPDRITLHTLAVKRASMLKERDENFSYRDEETREEMLSQAAGKLRKEGYRPYYLYRQKYTSGNTENTGWCRNDDIGIYNIRIMDEHQSILALGAGGISKRYFPEEDRIERIPNVSNYEIYIQRIEDMIARKGKAFFIR